MSNLCFLQSPDLLRGSMAGLMGENSTFVPMSWPAGQFLKKFGGNISWPQELLKNNAETIHRHAWDFSTRWYCDGEGNDPTVVDGISLGHALAVHAWNALIVPMLKNYVIALRSVKAMRPETVLVDECIPKSLKKSLKVLSLAFPFSFVDQGGSENVPDLHEGLGSSIAWTIQYPRFWRDVFLKMTFNLLSNTVRTVYNPSVTKKILMAYYPTQHALYSRLMSSATRGGVRWGMLEWPPRDLALKFLAAGVPIVDTALRPVQRHREKASKIHDAWRSWISRPGFVDQFLFEGISVWPLLQEGLDILLSTYLPLLLGRLEMSGRLFRHSRYQGLVVPYDSTPESRILVSQAKRYGIPTILATHGIGFIHDWDKGEGMQSHVVAPPGPAVGAQYIEAGIPPSCVWPMGPGLMDEFCPRPETPPTHIRHRVLVLTNPSLSFSAHSGPGFEEDYLITVLSVLRRFQGLTISLKLHPAESVDFYQNLLREANILGVAILWKEPFKRIVENFGTVIGTMSTSLIQAMVRRRWVISANVMEFPFPEPYNESYGFPVARNQDALEVWLKTVLGPNPPPTDYEPLLSQYAGNLDGHESERFLSRLKDYCSEQEVRR